MALQRNVQQQNDKSEHSIRRRVAYWKEHGVPEALTLVGSAQGIDWNRSIVVHLEVDFPGMPELFGTLVTQDQRFIAFEIASSDRIQVERWEDVTAAQDFNHHNRGTGLGWGALVLKVFQETNA